MSDRPADDLIFGAREIAEFVGVPQSWVYRPTFQRDFSVFRLGNRICVSRKDVHAALDRAKARTLIPHLLEKAYGPASDQA